MVEHANAISLAYISLSTSCSSTCTFSCQHPPPQKMSNNLSGLRNMMTDVFHQWFHSDTHNEKPLFHFLSSRMNRFIIPTFIFHQRGFDLRLFHFLTLLNWEAGAPGDILYVQMYVVIINVVMDSFISSGSGAEHPLASALFPIFH